MAQPLMCQLAPLSLFSRVSVRFTGGAGTVGVEHEQSATFWHRLNEIFSLVLCVL